MNRHVHGIVFLGGLTACGSPQATWKLPPNALALEQQAETFTQRWHQALADGDAAGWTAGFAPDGLYIGVDPTEVLVGREAIAARQADSQPLTGVTSEAGVSSDGRSAWVASELDAGLSVLRATTVLEHDGTGWRVLLSHHSRPVEPAAPVAAPAEIADDASDSARPLAELMSTSLAGADAFTAVLSKRPGIAAFGPGPADRYGGTHEVSEWLRALYGKAGTRIVRSGGLRADLAAGGQLGWIATNVDLVTLRDGVDQSRPCRLTAVFAREGDGWAIVQLHLSQGERAGE